MLWLLLEDGEDLRFPISSSSGFSSPFAFLVFYYTETKKGLQIIYLQAFFKIKYPFYNHTLLPYLFERFQIPFSQKA